MNTPLKIIWIVGAALLTWAAQAEPLNVLVQDVTFPRPESWRWEPPPTNSTAVTRFVVPGEQTKILTDVRFYVTDNDAALAKKDLKTWFPDSVAEVTVQRVTIGQRTIVYLQQSGDYVYKNQKKKPGHIWLGAVIPAQGKYVYVRVLGPQAEMDKASYDFKKMVQDALEPL